MRVVGMVGALLLVGCASEAHKVDTPDNVADDVAPAAAPRRATPIIESEVGALDRDAVDAAFAAVRGDVKACIDAANQGLPFEVVGGDIEIEVRIKSDGSVRHAYPKRSSIGHVGAEKCILEAVRAQSWLKPKGAMKGSRGRPTGSIRQLEG